MIANLEFLGLPQTWIIMILGVYVVIQIIGEILEFKGKVVPEFMKIRKRFARKKEEREAIAEMRRDMKNMSKTIQGMEKLVEDFESHYSKDNITKRDSWMQWVNNKANIYDNGLSELEKKMDKIDGVILSVLIEIKRNTIIDFASKVIDEKYPVTREQFNRIFKIHKEYEEIIETHDLTNGEVEIAIRIIEESYEEHMKNHTFIEDVRGY